MQVSQTASGADDACDTSCGIINFGNMSLLLAVQNRSDTVEHDVE